VAVPGKVTAESSGVRETESLRAPCAETTPAREHVNKLDIIVIIVITSTLGVTLVYLIRSGLALEPLLQAGLSHGPGSERAALDASEVVLYATTYAIAWRRNAAILAGCAIALIGCVIVLLRVRTSTQASAAGFSSRVALATDSAGLFVCLLGTALLSAAALLPMEYQRTVTRSEEAWRDPGPSEHILPPLNELFPDDGASATPTDLINKTTGADSASVPPGGSTRTSDEPEEDSGGVE
jgi:hypothetical protein